jgi:hypothetical protein
MMQVRESKRLGMVLGLIGACLMSTALHAQYGGGTGEPNDPYLIYTPEQMNALGANPSDWDKHFKLTADIDLGQYTGSQFNVIGYLSDWPDLKPFCGVFDGDGHVISNFTWSSDSRKYVGLFAYVDRKLENGNHVGPLPEISNLSLRNCSVSAEPGATAGVLAGYLSQGRITDCRVEGGHVSGGLVGVLAGNNAYGTISRCYATGAAISKNGHAGGLISENSGTVVNCYSMATANAYRSVGGLIAFNWNTGTVVNCYATGDVSGPREIGGLVGSGDGAVISSYWDCETSKQPESPGGGYSKSTAEMCQSVTFVGWTPPGGEPIWAIDEGNDYPRLYWENRSGAALASPPLRSFLSGNGTKDDPFLIQTAEQLHLVGQCVYDWDKHFRLLGWGSSRNLRIPLCPYRKDWRRDYWLGIRRGRGHRERERCQTQYYPVEWCLLGWARGLPWKWNGGGLLCRRH